MHEKRRESLAQAFCAWQPNLLTALDKADRSCQSPLLRLFASSYALALCGKGKGSKNQIRPAALRSKPAHVNLSERRLVPNRACQVPQPVQRDETGIKITSQGLCRDSRVGLLSGIGMYSNVPSWKIGPRAPPVPRSIPTRSSSALRDVSATCTPPVAGARRCSMHWDKWPEPDNDPSLGLRGR